MASMAQTGTGTARVTVWPGRIVTDVGSWEPTVIGGAVFVCSNICNCQFNRLTLVASVLLRVSQISSVQTPLAVWPLSSSSVCSG